MTKNPKFTLYWKDTALGIIKPTGTDFPWQSGRFSAEHLAPIFMVLFNFMVEENNFEQDPPFNAELLEDEHWLLKKKAVVNGTMANQNKSKLLYQRSFQSVWVMRVKKVVVIDPKNGNRNEADCKTDKFGGYGQQSSETTSKRKISDGWHKQFKNQQCHNNSDHPIAKGFNPGCTFNASRNSLLH